MSELAIRPYEDADEAAVLDLLATSLGKTADDRYRRLFRWKHLDNPFGRSFMWVGARDGRILGFRSFLRWRFVDAGGAPVEAVRAVDTATHPDARGTGIFRSLTMHGLDELKRAGIAFVFNTPNDLSRPGYLKMGWRVEGRVPVKVRPRSTRSLWMMARSRTAAEPWSIGVEIGEAVDGFASLAVSRRASSVSSLVTERSPALVRWRYAGFPAVGSRALPVGTGAVLVRFRARGETTECTLGDVLGDVDPSGAASAVRSALRDAGADYAIASASTPVGGMIPVPRLGPIQTRHDLDHRTSGHSLSLVLGDIELF